MGRPTTLQERNNIECPDCGGILTRSRGGGRSDHGDYRLRRRVCEDCRLIFTTIELPLLYDDGSVVPLSALDSRTRLLNLKQQRKQRGYHGTAAGRKPIAKSAHIYPSVSVKRPTTAKDAGPWPIEEIA